MVVIFSVLLALALDQWRDNRSLERQVEHARRAFAEEIEGNRAILRDPNYGREYHKKMWDTYKRLHAAYRANDMAEIAAANSDVESNFNTGVHPPALRDAVWRSLSQSDLVRHMRPDELFVLADVYREQDQLDRGFRRMLDIWLMPTIHRNEPAYLRDDANVTRLFMADVVASEDRLLKGYEKALSLLGRAAR
jgi:hypothetical protein